MSSPERTRTETETPTHTGEFTLTDHNIARPARPPLAHRHAPPDHPSAERDPLTNATEALPRNCGRASMRWGTVCESAWYSPRQNSAVTHQRCVPTANAWRSWVSPTCWP